MIKEYEVVWDALVIFSRTVSCPKQQAKHDKFEIVSFHQVSTSVTVLDTCQAYLVYAHCVHYFDNKTIILDQVLTADQHHVIYDMNVND